MKRSTILAVLAGSAIAFPAAAQDTHWVNAVNGNWHDAARWSAGIPNSAAALAYIDQPGGYTVTLNASATVSQLYKFFPGPQLNIANGTSLFIAGGVFGNNGATVVNASAGGSGTQIRFDANSEIQAGAGQFGEIRLNANAGNLDTAYINTSGAAVVTNTQFHTIDGTGNIYANMINNGRIISDIAGRTLQLLSGTKTNAGQITANADATLRLSSTTLVQTGAGYVSAEQGSVIFNNSTLGGGSLNTTGAGIITFEASNTVNGAIAGSGTLRLSNGGNLFVSAPWNHTGTFTVNTTAGGSATQVRIDADSTFSGGTVILNANGGNRDTAYLNTSGAATLTIGPSTTVTGFGNIYAKLTNNGSILADAGGESLQLLGNAKLNNSIIRASNGGAIQLSGTTLSQSVSGAFEAVGAGSFVDVNGATVNGGNINANAGGLGRVVTGNATFTGGVGGSGPFTVNNGNLLVVDQSAWNHNGVVTVNHSAGGSSTYIRFDQNCTVNDATFVLNANSANRDTGYLQTSGAAVITLGPTSTVTGFGRIHGTTVNNGNIAADASGEVVELVSNTKTNNNVVRASNTGLVILNGITFNQSASGVLEAVGASSFVDIYGTTVNGGNINASGGGLARLVASNATFTGGVGGSGPFTVNNGNLLVVNQPAWNHNGVVTVNHSAGGSGTFIRFDQNCTVNGAQFVLNANGGNRDTGYLQTGGAAVITLGPTSTVTGFGRIHGTTVNNGNIAADASGEVVELVSNTKTNNNVVRASNSGLVMLNGITFNQSASGVLEAVGASSFVDIYGSTVNGGNINASGGGLARLVASNATFTGGVGGSGPFTVNNGNLLVVNQPTWNHNGVVTVNHSAGGSSTFIRFDQNCTVNDAEVRLNANAGNFDTGYLTTGGSAVITVGETASITGKGNIHGNTLVCSGTLAPGSGGGGIGQINLIAPINMQPSATASFEIAGTAASQFDRITGSTLTANGTIRIRLANGYIPSGGETYDVVTVTTRNGFFPTIDSERFANGTNRFAVEYLPGKVRLRAKLCPADFDGDGFITGVDFDEFVIAFETGDILADVDGDGFITGIDFDEFVQTLEGGC